MKHCDTLSKQATLTCTNR